MSGFKWFLTRVLPCLSEVNMSAPVDSINIVDAFEDLAQDDLIDSDTAYSISVADHPQT